MKKRFNIIDVLIIVCVAFIALAVVFRGQITAAISAGKNLDSFTVTFESDPVDNMSLRTLKAGQSIIWVEADTELGTMYDYRAEEARIYTAAADGKLVESKSDSQSVIRGSMKIKAEYRDGSCYVSGTRFLGGGMKLTLRTEYATFTVTVISVEK